MKLIVFTCQFDGTWWFFNTVLIPHWNVIFAWLDLRLALGHLLQAHLLAICFDNILLCRTHIIPNLKLFLIPNSHHLVMAKHQHLLIKCQPVFPRSQCPAHHTRHWQLHNPLVMVLYMLHRHHHHHHHHQPVCIPQSQLSHSRLHIQSTLHRGLQDLVHLEVVLGQGTWNLQPKHHIPHHQVEGKDVKWALPGLP